MGTSAIARNRVSIAFLLDEHYPGYLADPLASAGVDAVALVRDRPDLRGADDREVLESAVAEHRVVVTEDVATFGVAISMVPDHVGVVFCHHSRFPRTRPGLATLAQALVTLADSPPEGLGEHPIVWWLAE